MDVDAPTDTDGSNQFAQKSLYMLMFVICVETIVGNVLLLIVVLQNKTFGNKSSTNYLIASLAISDLVIGTFVLPVAIIWQITDKWILGHIFCELWQTVDVFMATVSLLNICAISLDRYLAINDPFRYPLKMTKRRVFCLIAAIWIIAAFIAFPQMIYDLVNAHAYDSTTCEFIFANPSYAVFLTTCTFFVPLFVISIVNYRTYKIASIQIQKVYKQTSAVQEQGVQPQSNGTKDTQKTAIFSPLTKKQLKLTRSVFVVVFVFVICWTPYFVAYSINSFCHSCLPENSAVYEIAGWLSWLNSGLNPIVYTVSSKCFRKLFFTTLMCRSTNHSNNNNI